MLNNDTTTIEPIELVSSSDKAWFIEGPIKSDEIGRAWIPKTQCFYNEGDDYIRIKDWMLEKLSVDYSYKTVRHQEWDGTGYYVARVAYGLDMHAMTLMTPEERLAAIPEGTQAYNFRYHQDKTIYPGDIVACLSVKDLKNALAVELIEPTEENREEYNKATAWIIDTIDTTNYIQTKSTEEIVNDVNDRINAITGDD